MNTIRRNTAPALIAILAAGSLMAVSPRTAWAQAGTPPAAPVAQSCDVDETSPTELTVAMLSLTGATTADTNRANKLRSIRSVILNATKNIERGQNLAGRNYIMAKAFSVLIGIPDHPQVMTRGDLGFTTNVAEQVDLVVAFDSLLNSVVKSNPSCATEVAGLRLSQAFVNMLQEATLALHGGAVDSAEKLVRRAQLLEKETPYTWQMLASIYMRRDSIERAIEYWAKTYETAARDTSAIDVKMQALYFLGETNLGIASARQGAAQATSAREAAKHFRQFVTEQAKHKDAASARANLATALMMAGDTAQVPAVYADLLARPTEFTANDHLQAGVSASTARFNEDAVKLFGFALASSPFDRDALFNLSVSMFNAKMFSGVTDIAWRLVDVDPNSADNMQMLVYAYAMIERNETDAARKKVWGDSLQKFSPMFDKLDASHKVEYRLFSKDSVSASLAGLVYNKAATERSFRLEHDFLDKDGRVIDSQVVTVGPVKQNEPMQFNVKSSRPGVVAFKAKPIPPPN